MTINKQLPGEQTVLIIGAGAAGLLAARQLSSAGMKVIVVEAASYAGGRMHTLNEDGFSEPVEAGAEFIHGNQPITLGLLQEAGIEFTTIAGEMKTVRAGQWLKDDPMGAFWEEMIQHMNDVKQDITIDAFMNKYFNDSRYAPLRDSIIRFAEGFDLADTNKASVLSLREEWSHEFEEDQYRITGGYSLLAEYLADCCKRNKVQFYFSSEVSEISWSPHKVFVHTPNGTIEGNKLLITVSAGIMQSRKIRFNPEPTETLAAFNDIGYGTVMKFLLEFREPFWTDSLGHAGFVLSDEPVPTWWTQSGESKLLTGWLGGPTVTQRTSMSDIELIDLALQSLSSIFQVSVNKLKEMLVQAKLINWTKLPVSLGGYSYSFPNSEAAKKMLCIPIEETLFFAGEALYSGDAPGTVEAAFVTGQQAAVRILGS